MKGAKRKGRGCEEIENEVIVREEDAKYFKGKERQSVTGMEEGHTFLLRRFQGIVRLSW
jgi:hypothetical protein